MLLFVFALSSDERGAQLLIYLFCPIVRGPPLTPPAGWTSLPASGLSCFLLIRAQQSQHGPPWCQFEQLWVWISSLGCCPAILLYLNCSQVWYWTVSGCWQQQQGVIIMSTVFPLISRTCPAARGLLKSQLWQTDGLNSKWRHEDSVWTNFQNTDKPLIQQFCNW